MNKTKTLCAFLLMVFATAASAQTKLRHAADTFSYSLGIDIAGNIRNAKLEELEIEVMLQGIRDVLTGKNTELTPEQAQLYVKTYFEKKEAAAAGAKLREAELFLEQNKKKKGVITLPSGLQYEVLVMGKGDKPKASDEVTTHYHGTLLNGEVFDSSVERGEPATFPVNGVIPGWVEALQLMPVGSKWRLFVPASLAYGEHGAGGVIGPNETLIFEVELLSIKK